MNPRLSTKFIDRELSWTAFNERVLQEAADERNPLFERLTFLAIFSSNLDEFFRVRVASLRTLLRLKKKKLGRLNIQPRRLLREILQSVAAQQERFGEIFRGQILPALERSGVFLLNEGGVTPRQGEFLRSFFQDHVADHIEPIKLEIDEGPPFLENQSVYLVVELWPEEPIALSVEKPRYALVDVPTQQLSRFVVLPAEGDRQVVMFLDDVIRYNLPSLFPGWDVGGAYAIKLTRDAELYIEDEFAGDLVDAIRSAVAKRDRGVPSRFLYDLQASYAMVSFLKEVFGLEDEDLVLGGRYHNLHDLADFPRFGLDELTFDPWSPLPHPGLAEFDSLIEATRAKDRLLHFPYQSYQHVVRFLVEAAEDPDVEEIWLTVYRVTSDSEVLATLLKAAEQGKKVRVFVEVKARFDEATNLRWAEKLEKAGILTIYSMPGLKVHAKAALVVRREGSERQLYAYLGTGNFNEKTAQTYTDWGLLTADPRLTNDVQSVFQYLAGELEEPTFEHCLVAPFSLRGRFYGLIDDEIRAAEAGQPAGIIAKMNGLQDPEMIEKLYEAARAGVPIELVVRGICSLVPGIPEQSESIKVLSILDRYLEHGRAFVFHSGGAERIYLASADWMNRNLSRRVEIAFPVYDEDVRNEIREALSIQLADNVKARIIDAGQSNAYVAQEVGLPAIRTQTETRAMVERLWREASVTVSVPASGVHREEDR